ncbi:MAG TPA: hypothetical protein VFI69_02485 [Candidatus Limnocylindrales bacterium]|jgi:hypothetical protein|nr:hypothetical protein [Candidatus Limnocylindrales bacterium]
MDEQAVRDRAEAVCQAIVAGDIDRVIEALSKELRQTIGEVVSLLPLPARSATVDSIDHGGSAFVVALRVVGEAEEAVIQTRWKDRDGEPTIVEASHLSRTELATPDATEATDGEEAAAP